MKSLKGTMEMTMKCQGTQELL